MARIRGSKDMTAYRVYLIGLGVLGLAIGLFVGLSQSPVVSGLIASLFGLLGVAGSFYLPWAQANAAGADLRRTSTESAREAAAKALHEATVSLATAESAEAKAKTEAEKAAILLDQVKQTRADLPADAARADIARTTERLSEASAAHAGTKQGLDKTRAEVERLQTAVAEAKVLLELKERDAVDALRFARRINATEYAKTYVAAGASLAVFGAMLVVSSVYGMLLRTGGNWNDLLPRASTAYGVEAQDGLSAVHAVLLDRLLLSLDVGDVERRQIVRVATTSCPSLFALQAKVDAAMSKLDPLTTDAALGVVGEVTNPMKRLQLALSGSGGVIDHLVVQAALKETLEAGAKLWLKPSFVPSNAEAAAALGEFQREAVGYVGCDGTEAAVKGLLASLKEAKDTPLAERLTQSGSGFENVPSP
jgi:hypothetical protein